MAPIRFRLAQIGIEQKIPSRRVPPSFEFHGMGFRASRSIDTRASAFARARPRSQSFACLPESRSDGPEVRPVLVPSFVMIKARIRTVRRGCAEAQIRT